MFISLMKYSYFMTSLGQICGNSEYSIALTIIILMLQVDDFMNSLISDCFYHYFLNHHFMAQIHTLMQLWIFCWFYHHPWMVQGMTFMTFFLLNPIISQGALWDTQGAPKSFQRQPQDLPRIPKDLPRTPKAANLMRFYVDLADCHQIISWILFV